MTSSSSTFITSLPHISECRSSSSSSSSSNEQLSLPAYKAWLISTAQLVLSRCPDDGVCIFFQTDIKVDGVWVDKAYLIQRAADELAAAEAVDRSGAATEHHQRPPHALLWHKIVCRTPAGEPTFTRPAYHHMLCFSRTVRIPTSASTADVLPAPGDTTWARGMGTAACAAAVRFVRDHAAAAKTVLDPFCGHGTVLAVANQLGLNAVGVEISPKRAKQAQQLCMEEVSRRAAVRRGSGRRQQQQPQQQQQQQLVQNEQQQQAQDSQGEVGGSSGGGSGGSGIDRATHQHTTAQAPSTSSNS